MPVHAFPLEIKQLTDKGQFRGLASTYGNVDLSGDICLANCFTRTLAQGGKSRPLLWQHESPLGLCDLEDGPDGLDCEGQLSMGIQLGRDAYQLLKDGVVRGLSIGFQTIKDQINGDGVRELIELRLFEISLVTFPANEMATVAGIKAAQQDKIRSALDSFRSDILKAFK